MYATSAFAILNAERSDENMNFSEILVKKRRSLGLSQDELAEKIQVSRQAISKWENGETLPEAAKLIMLADIFDMSLDELCGREKYIAASAVSNTASAPVKKTSPLRIILISILAITAVILVLSFASPGPAPKDVAPLPDTVSATGVSFFCDANGLLYYYFTPTISSGDLEYSLVFTDYEGKSVKSAAVLKDGICSGSAKLLSYIGYSVSMVVSSPTETRAVALVKDLTFSPGHISYLDLLN